MDRETVEVLEGLRRGVVEQIPDLEHHQQDQDQDQDQDIDSNSDSDSDDMHVSVFNTPIGYLKRPLFQERLSTSPQDRFVRPLLETRYAHQKQQRKPDIRPVKEAAEMSTLDISNLPVEIMETIGLFLDQGDCLKIMLLNKASCEIMKRRLYNTIVVDSLVDLFNKDDPTKTYINSSYAFKRFLHKNNTDDFSLVEKLVVMEYFEINPYERQFQALVSVCLSHLSHVRHLEWLPQLHTLMLSQLPNLRQLRVLHVSLPETHDNGVDPETLPLPNLEVLEIITYHNCDVLARFLRQLELDPGKLARIQLHRYKEGKIYDHTMNPTASELSRRVGSSNPDHELQHVLKYVPTQCTNFQELVLDHIHVTSNLFASMAVHFPRLQNLTRLKLTNVVEYQGIRGDQLMLVQLSKVVRAENLVSLAIDWREANDDTVADFIAKLNKLEELDVVMRYNPTKGMAIDQMLGQYVQAMVCSAHTLRKLSLELKIELTYGGESFGDLNDPSMDKLVELQALESLRIPVRQGGQMHERLASLIPQLVLLRYLDLVGGGSGGQPNLGMGMIHPCVYDEWFKVQHVAILYCQMNDLLRYVRCNKRVFYCNERGVVEPKVWLDKWFEGCVRV